MFFSAGADVMEFFHDYMQAAHNSVVSCTCFFILGPRPLSLSRHHREINSFKTFAKESRSQGDVQDYMYMQGHKVVCLHAIWATLGLRIS